MTIPQCKNGLHDKCHYNIDQLHYNNNQLHYNINQLHCNIDQLHYNQAVNCTAKLIFIASTSIIMTHNVGIVTCITR